MLTLRFDGSAYHGWQLQKNAVTVQQKVNEAINCVLHENINVNGCSRTDTGVHAMKFCCNFKTDKSIPCDKLPDAFNAYLPSDISVLHAEEKPMDFHSRFSCVGKEYIYKILNAPIRDPFLKDRVCFYPQHLDLEQMRKAALAFEGEHDFRAVRSVGTETKTTVRTIYHCRVEKEGEMITVAICANGFLYNMCRAIVGTLVYASYGKLQPEEIPELLEKGDRRLTGPTMPPQGLYLNRLHYPDPVGTMFSSL